MRKIRNLVFGGIEQKVFNLVLFTVFMIILAYNVILIFQSKQLSELVGEASVAQQQSMAQISEATMQSIVDTTLNDSVLLEAEQADNMFREVKNDIRMLADYASKLYADPESYPVVEVKQPKEFSGTDPVLTWLHAEDTDPSSEEFLTEAGLLGNMGDMMLSLLNNSEYLGACYIATPQGLTLMCDAADASAETEEEGYVFDSRPRPWYIGAERTGGRYFTGIERDYYTNRIGIVCAVPIYRDGKLVAVVGGDLFLDSMDEGIREKDSDVGFQFIVDGNGHVIFSPKTEGLFQVLPQDIAPDLRETEYAGLSDLVSRAVKEQYPVREVECPDGTYYMAGAPMRTVGWAVVIAVDKEATLQPTYQLQQQHQAITSQATETYRKGLHSAKWQILILLTVICILAILNAMALAKKIVRPLNTLTKRIGELSGEDPAFEMADTYRSGDEIEVLAKSFAELSLRTREYMAENLKITAEKERIGAELNVATRIQADMLPRIFPPFPERKEFDMYASMHPAKEVGGDFYDFFLVDDDHLAMVMADVSGKGVPAALFMVIAKTLIKNRAQMGGNPGEIIADVNRQLCESNTSGLFVTVWLAILQISTGKGIAANAGHEHPALCHAGGEFAMVEYKHSPPLGLIEDIPCREHEFTLLPGDRIFVYTDGVTEASATRKNLFGEQRVLDALNAKPEAHPKDVVEHMAAEIAAFVGDADQFDDITMLCFEYYGSEVAS